MTLNRTPKPNPDPKTLSPDFLREVRKVLAAFTKGRT